MDTISFPGTSATKAAPGPMTGEVLTRHLARMAPHAARVALADLLATEPISCVDGRKPRCAVGAPGGNAGLFILLLSAFEAFAGRQLTATAIEQLFESYLERFNHFYLHSDSHAASRLQDALSHDERLSARQRMLVRQADADALLAAPPEDIRPVLLEQILRPEHVGCGHLRLMLESPERYGARRELIEQVLRVFFQTLWEGDSRAVFEVLRGDHNEQAVVRIHIMGDDESDRSDESPLSTPPVTMVCPHYEGMEVFVHHPEAVRYLELEHAFFLAWSGLVQGDEVA
ncbi:MAG: hypothetical protein ACOCTG_01395, partial [Bacteroidota bacterium]